MNAGAEVNNVVADVAEGGTLATDADVVVVVAADGKLYFRLPVLWPLSSDVDWSLLLCRM